MAVELQVTGKPISIGMVSFSDKTISEIQSTPGVTSVIQIFPESKDTVLMCMLMAYTDADPNAVALTIAEMGNVEYAQATPERHLILPVED